MCVIPIATGAVSAVSTNFEKRMQRLGLNTRFEVIQNISLHVFWGKYYGFNENVESRTWHLCQEFPENKINLGIKYEHNNISNNNKKFVSESFFQYQNSLIRFLLCFFVRLWQ